MKIVPMAALAAAVSLVLAGCGSSSSEPEAAATTEPAVAETVEAEVVEVPQGACPGEVIDIVVSVNQWGDIVEQLGGACANVTTILTDPNIDPHDYEPKPTDIDKFSEAQLVVVNGAGYDDWATSAARNHAPSAPLVSAGEVVGVQVGSNPHLWYNPVYVIDTADAVTGQMSSMRPDAQAFFATQRTEFQTVLQPYLDAVAALRSETEGKSYAATETIFNYMAAAVGLQDRTPSAYEIASINERPQAPKTLKEFRQLLNKGKVSVLIFNTQTSDPVAEEFVGIATKRGIPVVNVTETVPPQYTSFVAWQMAQLAALADALQRAMAPDDHDDHDHDDHDDHDHDDHDDHDHDDHDDHDHD